MGDISQPNRPTRVGKVILELGVGTKKGWEGKEGKKGVVTKGGAWGRKRRVMLRDVRNPLIAVALVSREDILERNRFFFSFSQDPHAISLAENMNPNFSCTRLQVLR